MNLVCAQTAVISSPEELDPDTLSSLACLQCFRDRATLIDNLLNPLCEPSFTFYTALQ